MSRLSRALALVLALGAVALVVRHRRQAALDRQIAALCGGCHRIPAGQALTADEWSYALSYMALFLGQELGRGEEGLSYARLHPPRLVRELQGTEQFMTEMGTIPDRPAVSDALWLRMRERLLARAREARQPPPAPPRSLPSARFRAVTSAVAGEIPSLLRIEEGRIFIGEAGTGGAPSKLSAVGPGGEVLAEAPLPGAPAQLTPVPGGHELTLIGDFFPTSDRRPAALWFVPDGQLAPTRRLLRDLPRTANVLRVDLDGDGALDRVVAGFGLGTLVDGGLLFERARPGGGFQEEVLWPQPGVLQVAPLGSSLLVLLAGGREGLYRLDGCPAACRASALREEDPSFGANQMQLADLDGDGRPEIVLVNGDSLDVNLFGAVRPQHGVRVLTLDGVERFFYPLPGATNAVVADLDGDGRPDIAAVAAYPDQRRRPLESFVVLRQSGSLAFQPLAHPAAGAGRWLTLAAGDLDGDGDVDLALGGLRHALGGPAIAGQPSLLILINEARP
jgi:hypothetical protein